MSRKPWAWALLAVLAPLWLAAVGVIAWVLIVAWIVSGATGASV